MMPPESPDELAGGAGVGALAGLRGSSEIYAYGGIVSSISCVVMHPAASAIAPPTIAAARVDFRLPITRFVSAPGAGSRAELVHFFTGSAQIDY